MPGFSWLVHIMRVFFDWIFNTLQGFGLPNYGLAILILTVIIKTALQPLNAKQVKSMKALQEIQPKIKELQEKYKGNPEMLNREIADLYKEYKVNPFMGCLPILIQMPFLIALFYVLRDYPYIPEYEHFLWVPNLGKPDPYWIMPALVGITTYIQMKLSPSSSDPSQKMISIIMPIFIAYISLKFPAGLSLYWTLGNVYSIVYQYFVNKRGLVTKGASS